MAYRPTKAAKRRVAEMLSDVAEQAAALPIPVMQDFLPALVEARESLRRDLASWLRNVPDAEARFTVQQYRSALTQIESALHELEHRVPKELKAALTGATPLVAETVMEHMAMEIAHFSKLFGGPSSLIQLPFDKAALVSQQGKARIFRHARSARRYGKEMANNIRRQLAVGLVRQENFSQLTTRLMNLGARKPTLFRPGVPKTGNQATDIAHNMFHQQRWQAERLVRTEVIDAYNEDAFNGLKLLEQDDPGWKKRWDATRDLRGCDWCKSLDGKIVGIDENFETGLKQPPAHPNCRCGITPWREEWGDEKQPAAGFFKAA